LLLGSLMIFAGAMKLAGTMLPEAVQTIPPGISDHLKLNACGEPITAILPSAAPSSRGLDPVVVEDPGEAHGRLVRPDGKGSLDSHAARERSTGNRTRIKFDVELTLVGQHAAEPGQDRDRRIEGARGVSDLEGHALEVSGAGDGLTQ
jgi:hypothetical protein